MGNNDSGLATFVAGVSQTLLTLLGVDYYALMWAFIGSLGALTQAQTMTRSRAIAYVLLSTLVGAAFGSAAFAWLDAKPKILLLLCSTVGGFGWQLIMAALVQAVISRINTVGGVKQP